MFITQISLYCLRKRGGGKGITGNRNWGNGNCVNANWGMGIVGMGIIRMGTGR